jgi:tRNA A-37 threonylcarbamoyl transferase component Bud32
MQVEQHMRNLRVIRAKVGKVRTPKDHEAISKEITEAIRKIGCNPNKIFYTINNNKPPNFSVKKAIRTKVGTKKIGEGEYGEVFFGCVDKECKKDIAIKVQTEPLGIEYKIGKLISKFGGVNMYALESCKGKHIMYSEYANSGALEEFINKHKNTLRPIHYRFMITQVLYNLYRIHKKYPSFRHGDLHAKNILVNTDTPTLKINTYKIGNMTLKVEDVGLNLMLTDYGLSSTRVIKNPAIEGLDKEWGISQKSHPMYDVHLFLNAIFLVCSRIGSESAMETTRFIDRILPDDYKGSNTSKIMNFRMRINANHSNFPTFEKIFSDAYFLPYRSSNIKKKIDPLGFIPKAKPISKPKAKPVAKKIASASGIQKAKNILAKNTQKKAAPVKRRMAKKSPGIKVSVAPKGYMRVDGKKCTTYKKSELIEKAKKAGIDTQGKTIEKICEALKIKYVK